MKNFALALALAVMAALTLPFACGSDDDSDDEQTDDGDGEIDDDGSDRVLDLRNDDIGEDECQYGPNDGEAWVDSSSGLMWQTGYSCDNRTVDEVVDYCANLTVGGHIDWHVPSISDLRTLIRGCFSTATAGECMITDDCFDFAVCEDVSCKGCSYGDGPTDGCFGPSGLDNPCGWYWSSTQRWDDASASFWTVAFVEGRITSSEIGDDNEGDSGFLVRCVRNGESS
ncbi:MAG: DUF1566 domain-containing protein [Deltaproteobacteria bacterium]|nr:DUF1566 domain-containing protein [Deltaproteobacteria bacterium]